MDTHAARRPVHRPLLRRTPVVGAVAASLALCGSGAVGAAADDTRSVVVQPDRVAPGGDFSVFDGGNCPGGSGEVTFDGTDIPKLKLSELHHKVGGTGTVPRSTAPGAYTVTLRCGAESEGPMTQGEAEGEAQGDVAHGPAERGRDEPGGEHGHGRHGDGAHGRVTFTGTLTVSADAEAHSDAGPEGVPGTGAGAGADAGPGLDAGPDAGAGTETDAGPDQAVPKGGSHTGLGGGSGVGTGVTVLGGMLLAGAVGWGVVARFRRPRGGRG
ncbi:hypothetical protein [Streptomyces sp. NPDC048638]|uniref:hypothetical protein n=1 Tax=Streptomyces sp. NPDC048638 TaxID=3365580 RepID=UPI00371D004B